MSRILRHPPGRNQGPPAVVAGGRLAMHPQTGDAIFLGPHDPFDLSTEAVALAANGTSTVALRFFQRASFLIDRLVAVSTGAFSIAIEDDSSGRLWQDRPVRASLITGDARFPYWLPVPTLIGPAGTLRLALSDASGAPNTVLLILGGERISDRFAGRDEIAALTQETVYFVSTQLVLAAAIGAQASATVRMPADAPFELWHRQADDRANWEANFREQSGTTYWANRRVRAEGIFGDGQRPGAISSPATLPAHEDLTIEGTNAVAVAKTIEIVLAGAKLWGRS